jgi:hypothetical protein
MQLTRSTRDPRSTTHGLRGLVSSLLTPRSSLLLPLLFAASAVAAQDLTGAPCLPIPGGPPCPQQQGSMTSTDPATGGAATITSPTTGTPTTGVPTIRSPGRQPAPQVFPGQPQTFPPTQTVPCGATPTPPAPLKPGVAPPDAVATPPAIPQKPAVTTQPGLAPQPQMPIEFQRTEFRRCDRSAVPASLRL